LLALHPWLALCLNQGLGRAQNRVNESRGGAAGAEPAPSIYPRPSSGFNQSAPSIHPRSSSSLNQSGPSIQGHLAASVSRVALPSCQQNFPQCGWGRLEKPTSSVLLLCIFTSNLKSVVGVQEEIVELGWVAGFAGGVESELGGRVRRTLCTTSERGFTVFHD
jgi:hypothetical protein